MRKILVVGLAVLLSASMAFASEIGQGCIGSGCGNVNGSFKINTLAIGGGIDADGQLVKHGAAGGISAAGGLTIGEASGTIKTIVVPTYGWVKINGKWKYVQTGTQTFAGGSASGQLDTVGGGLTTTEAGKYKDSDGLKHVFSASDSFAATEARLQLSSFGIANAEGCILGVAGEGSLNGSIMFNHGVSTGVAGQYGVGYFAGAAGTALFGKADVDAGVDIWGTSYSDSYRGKINNPDGSVTRVLGTNVGATTDVTSWGNQEYCGLAGGFLTGGWQAGGVAATHTVQNSPGGYATANAVGSYSGSGPLGCNFEGSAIGGTQTSATTVSGYNGSVMTSNASMKVTAKSTNN
jgi:hypothetical protein